jgi:hypothetical protein
MTLAQPAAERVIRTIRAIRERLRRLRFIPILLEVAGPLRQSGAAELDGPAA